MFSFSLIYTISIWKHSHCLAKPAKCFLFNYTMQPQSLLEKDLLFIYLLKLMRYYQMTRHNSQEKSTEEAAFINKLEKSSYMVCGVF